MLIENFWPLVIIFVVSVYSIENWYMHVTHPELFREASGFKRFMKEKFGPKGIPISTFIMGCLAVVIFQMFKFSNDMFVYLSGFISGMTFADLLVILDVMSSRVREEVPVDRQIGGGSECGRDKRDRKDW